MISHYPLLSTQWGPYHWASCPHILSVAYRRFCLLPDCPYWEVGCRASKCPHLGLDENILIQMVKLTQQGTAEVSPQPTPCNS